MNIHIQNIKFASTRNSRNPFSNVPSFSISMFFWIISVFPFAREFKKLDPMILFDTSFQRGIRKVGFTWFWMLALTRLRIWLMGPIIGPPQTWNALTNARLPFMEIDFGIHRPDHPCLCKNMTSRKTGHMENPGKMDIQIFYIILCWFIWFYIVFFMILHCFYIFSRWF